MKCISLHEAEYIAHSLAKEFLNYDEPIPDFKTRYPNKLESCLEQPFQRFDNKELYPSLIDKSTLLFYLIIKNHPFENGNKRMAVTITLVFLHINDHWLMISPDDLYDLACIVAKSKPENKPDIIARLRTIFKRYFS